MNHDPLYPTVTAGPMPQSPGDGAEQNERTVEWLTVKCEECVHSQKDKRDVATGEPYCRVWKQYIDCGCFNGSVLVYKDTVHGDLCYNPFFKNCWRKTISTDED